MTLVSYFERYHLSFEFGQAESKLIIAHPFLFAFLVNYPFLEQADPVLA